MTLVNEVESGEVFIALSGTLYKQNLICAEPRELRRTGNSLELSVVFRSRDSFNNWLNDNKVQEYWKDKFESLLTNFPLTSEEIDVIVEVDKVENCQCEKSKFYILQGRSFQFTNELTCGSCLKQIPYSRIPVEIKIEEWQNYHERFYLNWLESGIFEQEALAELTKYAAGKLNIEAERIRIELSELFKSPVYINHFVVEPDENHACLICGAEGTNSGLERPSKICKNCNTIFA